MRHALATPSSISRIGPSKQHSTLSLAWDQRLQVLRAQRPLCTVLALAGTCSAEIAPPTQTGAHFGFCSRSFSSIRSRCGRGWASRAASAPAVTPRTRGEIRPYYLGNSPMMWDESTIAAIEMAAERPTTALWGVCTHVRLSSFAWRRQGMSPRMRRAPPAQGL